MACSRSATAPKFYRRRDPEASPFYKLVADYFTEFERVYPERYQKRFGFWRPVIRRAIDKFIECGDLRNGFARVRCPECGEQFFVAFSCKQRGMCPSCDQKRSLILAYRLINEILATVPHRQWVFTIPKRLRIYFRYDRSLLGKLCRAAYDTVREAFCLEIEVEEGYVPGMVGAVQTFGELVHWHSHIHAIVSEGVFTESGHFVHVPDVWRFCACEIWQEKVFQLLLDEQKIDLQTVSSMRSWRHSGFSIDNSVRLDAGDHDGIRRLVEYIARCPFSLSRILKVTPRGKVLYRAVNAKCWHFPIPGDAELRAGYSRNFHAYDAVDFLAEVTQHIPDKGEHQIRYYGWYSNKKRGMRAAEQVEAAHDTPEALSAYQLKCRMTWAALIKCVYEVDPLECPRCGAVMKVIGFVEREEETKIRAILSRAGLWREPKPRAPPPEPPSLPLEPRLDYEFFQTVTA